MVEMMFGYFVESHAQIILKPASHQMRHKTLWQLCLIVIIWRAFHINVKS